jgi:LDH2 family malate/lactate/ureidoglycolate dehydrogenase
MKLYTALENPRIDKDNGIIRSVSLMEIGDAKGHYDKKGRQVIIDDVTLEQLYRECKKLGKVKVKAKLGQMMPPGWMMDRNGQPLLDPKRADEGFLVPIGEHKGYGLALIVGLLAGTLGGAAMGREVVDFNADFKTTTNTGQAILVIDLAAFGDPEHFKKSVDQVVRDLRSSARLPGVDRIWVPGEQSHEKRMSYGQQGIPVSQAVLSDLNLLAEKMAIPPLQVKVAG